MANYNPPAKPFQKGNAGKPKGAVSKKTHIISTLNMKYSDCANYMETTAFDRFVREMEQLDGRDYVTAYLALLEYIKPKLSRMEVRAELTNEVVNVFGMIPNEPTKIPVRIEPQTDEDILDISEHIEISDTE